MQYLAAAGSSSSDEEDDLNDPLLQAGINHPRPAAKGKAGRAAKVPIDPNALFAELTAFLQAFVDLDGQVGGGPASG